MDTPLIPHKPELAKGGYSQNYYRSISRNKELKHMMEQLMHRVRVVMNLANKHKQTFMEHAYLWTESRLVNLLH